MSDAYMVDARKLAAGGAALLVGLGVAGMFVWMTPQAAARETAAACSGLRPATASPTLGAIPRMAPDFTAMGHDGKPVKLSDFLGKVVVVNFWASWCNVCKTEKPSLSSMTNDLADDEFAVITMASDHDWADVQKVLPNGAPYQVLLDPPKDLGRPGPLDDDNLGAIAQAWGVKAVPDTFVIDKKGNLRMYMINKRDWDSAVAETCLQALIDE